MIVDYEMAQIMIHYFVSKAIGTRRFVRPRVVVTMPGDVSKVERRAVINTMEKIGARQIFVVEQAFAAALGTGLPVYEPQGSFIVDIACHSDRGCFGFNGRRSIVSFCQSGRQ